MKKFIFGLLACISWQLIFAQTNNAIYKSRIKEADSLFKQKAYKNATLAYTEAFKSLGWKGAVYDRYNAARAWALTNVPDSAFDCLTRIIKKDILPIMIA